MIYSPSYTYPHASIRPLTHSRLIHSHIHPPTCPRYLFDASRYTAAIVSLIFFEKGRKDSKPMFLHHITTVVITLASYNIDFTRVGAVVKVIMDPADVPLHAAKVRDEARDVGG